MKLIYLRYCDVLGQVTHWLVLLQHGHLQEERVTRNDLTALSNIVPDMQISG